MINSDAFSRQKENPSENVAHDISREEARDAEEQERQDRVNQSEDLAKKAHQQAKAFAGENIGYIMLIDRPKSHYINSQ